MKVWDYQSKNCVATLTGHTNYITSCHFHPTLPLIITSSEDGTIRIYNSNTFKQEKVLNYGYLAICGLILVGRKYGLFLLYQESLKWFLVVR